MIEFILNSVGYILPFLFVLTILVVVHELGHYLIARAYGVTVETFSVGFGTELFGYTDRLGTRWRLSLIPLGGYVKMFGDDDAASARPRAGLSSEDFKRSFHAQTLGKRSLIIAAGPLANFLFAIAMLALLFSLRGQPFTSTEIIAIQEDTPAHEVGLRPGDVILEIDGKQIQRFEQIQTIVQLNPNTPLNLRFLRQGQEYQVSITPEPRQVTDLFGTTKTIGLIGISRSALEYKKHPFPLSLWHATQETGWIISLTLTTVQQMILGQRGTEDLGGPLRIAQMSWTISQSGFFALIWFMALLSINLGLINLFPIPLLDGGHLTFYAIEAIRGKPLERNIQEYGIRIGFALVIGLMIFAFWNDLVQLRIVEFLQNAVF